MQIIPGKLTVSAILWCQAGRWQPDFIAPKFWRRLPVVSNKSPDSYEIWSQLDDRQLTCRIKCRANQHSAFIERAVSPCTFRDTRRNDLDRDFTISSDLEGTRNLLGNIYKGCPGVAYGLSERFIWEFDMVVRLQLRDISFPFQKSLRYTSMSPLLHRLHALLFCLWLAGCSICFFKMIPLESRTESLTSKVLL